MVDGGQTLVEGFVMGEAEGAVEFGLADQEESAEGLGVHVGREEQAELGEGGVGEQMGLVED